MSFVVTQSTREIGIRLPPEPLLAAPFSSSSRDALVMIFTESIATVAAPHFGALEV
jgi:hypothetical protein